MKTQKLFLQITLTIGTLLISANLAAFAADAPPAIESPFGSTTTTGDAPPSLSGPGGDTPPVVDGPVVVDPPKPPVLPKPPVQPKKDLPKTGPEIAFLLIPALALGRIYSKRKK